MLWHVGTGVRPAWVDGYHPCRYRGDIRRSLQCSFDSSKSMGTMMDPVLLTALSCPFQSRNCTVVTSVGYVPIDGKFEPSKLTGTLGLPHSVFKSSFLAECGPQPRSAASTPATLLLPDNSSQRTTSPPSSRWPRASSEAKDVFLAACREELSPAGASAIDPATRPELNQAC